MCEDYNSPQSVYWALKSFLALGLTEEHPFWKAKEKPCPTAVLAKGVDPPRHIICNSGNHHYLLSSGQFCPWPLKATEAKYGKFAYSSHFGFSVPTGTLLQQMAPDNTIAVSKDGGDTWRVPWKVRDVLYPVVAELRPSTGPILEQVLTLPSIWKPWRDADIEIHTVLIAPCKKWPNWYLRYTIIENVGQTAVTLNIAEGGFAIQGRGSAKGEVLPVFAADSITRDSDGLPFVQGTLETSDAALVCSDAGASGIRSLRNAAEVETIANDSHLTGHIIKPDANTNLMWQRTLIPTMRSEGTVLKPGEKLRHTSAIFAVARTPDNDARYRSLDLQNLWDDVPRFCDSEESETEMSKFGSYIRLGIAW
ncbi:hypothetical protein E8E13_002583 [Curvularia kusanoi]|uniref:Uncharacterized protein n=1 Tax=Curvularia kusanoi TaxID=90978 RepID=A0A9P4T4S7_CURKU|nr:hypothetical protein E8E13_002583 [Curvularia kusanoi]